MDFKETKRVLLLVLALNLVVAGAKILLGFFSGALSILSDGIHSLFDGMTNVVGYIGIKIAEKPADESHPYGHRKYEAIASQVILIFLIITAWEIIGSVFERIFSSSAIQPEINLFTFLILFLCVVIDAFTARYEYKKGEELKSTILKADALHTKSHYVTTGAVILGALLIKIGLPAIVDSIIALFVVAFVIELAFEIFKETSAVLSDKALLDIEKIKKIGESVAGVKSCHKIRTRGDANHVFLDIHIIVAPDIFLGEAHDICHKVCDQLQKEIPEIKDITVHPEP